MAVRGSYDAGLYRHALIQQHTVRTLDTRRLYLTHGAST